MRVCIQHCRIRRLIGSSTAAAGEVKGSSGSATPNVNKSPRTKAQRRESRSKLSRRRISQPIDVPVCVSVVYRVSRIISSKIYYKYTTATATAILRPLCGTTCVSLHHSKERKDLALAKFYYLHALADGY